MKLSVVIPTYNRGPLLARGLQGLSEQTLAREHFEVLVVDDGSRESPEPVVRPFEPRLALTLLRKPNGGLATARNFGAARARGEVLLFLDDDIHPCREFLEAHLAVHERHPRAVALGALPHPADLERTPFLDYLDRTRHYDLFLRYGSAERIPLPPLNGNSSVRREHFEAAGGYDVSFQAYGGEDTELGYRLKLRGLEFVYAPRARGAHYHSKGFDAYLKDQYTSGVALVAIVRRYPEVLDRVSVDVVAKPLRELRPGRWPHRLAFELLERSGWLRRALGGSIAWLERRGQRRLLHPLYLVSSHHRWARGMRDELRRGGLGGGA